AALIGAAVEHALFAQAELLAVLRSLRNLEQRSAVNCRHFDLRAQSCFVDPHRDADLDIVSFAMEERMLFHADGDVQIACWSSHRSGVALPGDSQSRALLRARRDSHIDGFVFRDDAVAVAGSAGVAQAARSVASRTRQAKAHRSRHLRYVPTAVAL